MITTWLMDFASSLITFGIGLFPTAGPPSWFGDANGYIQQVLGYGSGLGAWIPWGYAGTVVAAVLSFWLVGFGIKVLRIVLSFFLAGGGSAA